MPPKAIKVTAYLSPEEYQKMEHMSIDDSLSPSRFVAKLIEGEWIRRYCKPNPVTTVEQAEAAGAAVSGAALDAVGAHDPSVAEKVTG